MGDIEAIRHKLDVLKRHCEDVGRDYEEITKSTGAEIHLIENEANAEQETAQARGDRSYEEYANETIGGTPEMVRERLQPMIDAGIDYFIVTIPREAYNQEPVRRFAREVIPMFDPDQVSNVPAHIIPEGHRRLSEGSWG